MSNIIKSVVTIPEGYKTSDGKVFKDKKDAEEWEYNLKQLDDLSKLLGFMGGIL